MMACGPAVVCIFAFLGKFGSRQPTEVGRTAASNLYDTRKADWIPLPNAATITPRRSGHTAFSAGPAEPVFVFGGYIEQDIDGTSPFLRQVHNDLWKFDQDDRDWKKQPATGAIPGPRLASAAAVVRGNAYLFGGWDPQTPGTGGVILETVHRLNLDSLEWSLARCDLPDGPTSRHVALALSNDTILIHNHRCTDHVWIFHPEKETFIKQSTTGQSPGSLGLHTATMLDDRTVLVFGGAAKAGTMSNRSYLLDLKTWEWTQVDVEGNSNCPSPRAGACLCALKRDLGGTEKCAILFGGAETTESGLNPKGDVWALHLTGTGGKTGRWELLLDDKKEGDTSKPEPRNAATLTPIASYKGRGDACTFLMTGGWAPFRKTWDDVFILSIE